MDELKSLADLLDLQDVDSQIDRLLNRRHGLPELDHYRAADAKLQAINADLDAASSALRETTLALDKAEGELVIQQERKDIEERRLYAGGLGARETEHLRQEVQMLTRQGTELEDTILEIMERREGEESRVAELEKTQSEAESEKVRFEGLVAAEWKVIDAELARRESRKEAIIPLIPPDLLELYEELRPMKEGVAVGRLAEGVCGGCHLKLSAAEQVTVERQDPPRCLHCRRILVPQ